MLTIKIDVKAKTASVSYTETLDMAIALREEDLGDGKIGRSMADQDIMAHALHEAARLFKEAIAAYSVNSDDVKAKKAALDEEYAKCVKLRPSITMK